MRQAGLFGLSNHFQRLSADGDPLEELGRVVDFETFRPTLTSALAYSDGLKGGRPPYDPVLMFKVLILAARNNVSDARMEFLIRDRLSWMRFLGFDLGSATPDANTIRLFREKLTAAEVLDTLFTDFDHQLKMRGYQAMGGQIIDATLVAAPKPRNSRDENARIKAGETARTIWPDQSARAAQKDTDARWTLKFAKAKVTEGGRKLADIAIPAFGYKSTISICRRFGFIRKGKTTNGACFDGHRLQDVVMCDNADPDVWADTAYRSKDSEEWLQQRDLVSRIHERKPRGKPMSEDVTRNNTVKSGIRARVEHVWAHQKDKMGLFIQTIGMKRADTKIKLANIAYNMNRLIFHERRAATG